MVNVGLGESLGKAVRLRVGVEYLEFVAVGPSDEANSASAW